MSTTTTTKGADMPRRTAVLLAALALGLSTATAATAATNWKTGPAVAKWFKAHGLRFPDGSYTANLDGFCNGTGTAHGTYASPTYRTFDCTLVGGRYGASRWYDVAVRIISGVPRIVRVEDVY